MFFGNDDDKKSEDKNFLKYKFKSLQTYSSDEWMANDGKKYRTVFDKAETTYIRCEFAFYNKLFDEENWKCKVTLKALDVTNGKREELCSLDKELEVSKEENIIFTRDGWGNKTLGSFWIKGDYIWEAYIDGVLVGTQTFSVNNVGLVTPQKNPYFSVEHIKLYNGDVNGWKQKPEERKYYKQISKAETRYLWAEIKITNLVNVDWNYELFLNYYDDAGQHKAVTSRKGKIEAGKKEWTYTFDIGWGTDEGGSWKDDRYTIELVFMDALVAAAAFDCGDSFIEGEVELLEGS
ncbi:MAG: AAA family ATPase, partial [Bacteroidetes bacterium]|nr:AAA family ATPase [Bacteroidota bacterium]